MKTSPRIFMIDTGVVFPLVRESLRVAFKSSSSAKGDRAPCLEAAKRDRQSSSGRARSAGPFNKVSFLTPGLFPFSHDVVKAERLRGRE